MTPAQYKTAIKALGLSQQRAGDWLGISPRTSQGYCLGEFNIPEPTAKLLRLCIKLKEDHPRIFAGLLDDVLLNQLD